MPIHHAKQPAWFKNIVDGACEAWLVQYPWNTFAKYVVNDRGPPCKVVHLPPMNTQLVRRSASRTAPFQAICRYVDGDTARPILDNASKPAVPEHRSTTVMPGAIPTSLITLSGSGHNASHQPGSGISVPSKKPGSVIQPIR
jgi:hypothetical protein